MKKLLLIILVLGGAFIGGSYLMTGRLPWVQLSAEEQQVAALREEFDQLKRQWREAGRAALSGIDTGSTTEMPLAKLEQLEKALAERLPTLKTGEARLQASQLQREIITFKADMR